MCKTAGKIKTLNYITRSKICDKDGNTGLFPPILSITNNFYKLSQTMSAKWLNYVIILLVNENEGGNLKRDISRKRVFI